MAKVYCSLGAKWADNVKLVRYTVSTTKSLVFNMDVDYTQALNWESWSSHRSEFSIEDLGGSDCPRLS